MLRALGSLDADILVNNASAPVRGGVSWETAPDDIDALMDVNLRGTLNCLAAVVPGMKARGLGHIVNLGSTSGTGAPARHAGLCHDQGRHPQSQPDAAPRPARHRACG